MSLAVVTGGTRGFGAYLCQELLLQGWEVVVAGRDRTRYEALMQEVEAEAERRYATFKDRTGHSPEASGIPRFLCHHFEELDLLSNDSIDAFAARLRENFPPSLYLINNAADSTKGWDPAAYERCLQVNLWGTVRLTEKLGAAAEPGSKILNILCRQTKPRPGNLLSPAHCKEIALLAGNPDYRGFLKQLRRFSDFERVSALGPPMSNASNLPFASYAYSKALLWAYTQQAAVPFLEKRSMYLNSICPGHMDTEGAVWPTDRSPFTACGPVMRTMDFENLSYKTHKSYWLKHREHPAGYFFTSASLRPMVTVIDPNIPDAEYKKPGQKASLFIPELAEEPDWRSTAAGDGPSLLERLGKLFS